MVSLYNLVMRIHADNAHEASKQILRILYTTDYRYASISSGQFGYTYVYFSVQRCRYSFEAQQRRVSEGLIKRYGVLDIEDIITTTACKYSFTQIAIGAVLSRKMMNHREFFEMIRDHFDWIG